MNYPVLMTFRGPYSPYHVTIHGFGEEPAHAISCKYCTFDSVAVAGSANDQWRACFDRMVHHMRQEHGIRQWGSHLRRWL